VLVLVNQSISTVYIEMTQTESHWRSVR